MKINIILFILLFLFYFIYASRDGHISNLTFLNSNEK